MTDIDLLSLRALAEAATPGARESLAGFAALVNAGILPKDDPELRNVMDMAKLVIAVPLLLDRVEELEAALEEREYDMHARIRAGYDTTVADAWRVALAKVTVERDEARAALVELAEYATDLGKANLRPGSEEYDSWFEVIAELRRRTIFQR